MSNELSPHPTTKKSSQEWLRGFAHILRAEDGSGSLRAFKLVNAADELDRLQKELAAVRKALHEGKRAIGMHSAPDDCYATGPLTGNDYLDLVQCPACTFLALVDAALASREQGA